MTSVSNNINVAIHPLPLLNISDSCTRAGLDNKENCKFI